jgi:hypothetical protein
MILIRQAWITVLKYEAVEFSYENYFWRWWGVIPLRKFIGA